MLLWRERSLQFTEKAPTPARQLPITGSAHKAGNGRRPLPAATATARSARPPRRGNGSKTAKPNSCRFLIIHVVFTLPAAIGAVAFQNKAAVYDLLFRTAAETLTTLAADPKHLGARIGLTAVLHTWGSALTHHPHVHVIAPGGGLSPDGARWIACKPGFFLPVRALSRLFRRLFLEGLAALNQAGRLAFFGDLAPLAEKSAFDAALTRCAAPSGSSTPSGPSPDRRPYSPISRATPTASPSPTPGSSRSTTRASPSNGKTTGSKAATGSRP